MNRRVALRLVPVLLAVALPAAGWAPVGTIQGRVTDAAGLALAGARLALTGAAGQRTVVTDDGGGFRFAAVWPGSYRLEVDLAGYQWLEVRDLAVVAGRTVVLALVVRATTADESVLLTGAPLVDATAVDLATVAPATVAGWRDGVPGAGPDATDGASPGAVAWLGAGSPEVAVSLQGAPPAPAVRDLPAPAAAPLDEAARTVLWGGLAAAGVDRLGGGALAVLPAPASGHGSLTAAWSDESLAAAARPEPYGRAGWRGPARQSRLALAAGGALASPRLTGFTLLHLADGAERLRARPGGGTDLSDDLVGTRALEWYGSLDWHPQPRHRLWATASGRSDRVRDALTTVDRVGAVGGLPSDTRYDAERWTAAAQLAWLAVVDERLMIAGRLAVGRSTAGFSPADARPSFVDMTPDGRFGGAGGVVLGGAGFAAHRDHPELASLALELEREVAGGHRLRLAGRAGRERFEREWRGAAAARVCAPLATAAGADADCDATGDGVVDGVAVPWGAGTRVALDGAGSWVTAPDTSRDISGRATAWTLELADSWQAKAAWSLTAGLRAGEWSGRNGAPADTGHATEVRWDLADTAGGWLGFAWDFEGRGRSRLYGQLGRMTRPLTLDPDADLLVRGSWSAYRTAAAGAAGWDAPGTVTEVVGERRLVVDPNLAPSRLDDAVVGIEYEVLAGIVVGAAGLHRQLGRQVVAVTLDGGRSWLLTNAGRTVAVDPADGEPLAAPVRVAATRRDLDAIVAYGHRRWSRGWQLDAWLAWSHLAGSEESSSLAGWRRFDQPVLAHPFSPGAGEVAGALANDRRWRAQVAAACQLGSGLVVSGMVEAASGAPRLRTGAGDDLLGLDQRVVGPRGESGRTPSLVRIDGRLGWRIPWRRSLELALEVRNLLDRQAAVADDPRFTVLGPGADTATESRWGQPLIRQPPRTTSVVARWRF